MDLAALDALAKTLHLDEVSLDLAGTIRPGTLALTRPEPATESAEREIAPPTAPAKEREVPSLAATMVSESLRPPAARATLPLLDVRAGEPAGPMIDPAFGKAESSAAFGSAESLQLTSILGEGGMGVVWLARQRSLDREVAVKQLRSGSTSSSASGRALLAEARAAGALEHPSIVPVHALGVDSKGSPILVMKRVEGASLASLLQERSHPAWPELERRYGDRLAAQLEILERVADALHFAHARGFVHRDVKPENVMVGSFGEVYLLDWGLAVRPEKLTDEEKESIAIVGTPGFLAPEMVSGEAARVDARTDVYLLGSTLHAILTGKSRHEGTSLRALLVSAVLSEPFEYDASVPAELGALANDATAAEPSARPATAAAFRQRITDFLRHRSSLRLAEEARAKLDGVAHAEVARMSGERFSMEKSAAATLLEARFGFTQALREWPGNAAAKEGLRETVRALALAELRRRSPDAAEELAHELDPPDPEISAKIATLREELAESRRLEESARQEVRERDPRIGARVGVIIQSGLMLGMAGIGLHGAFFSGGFATFPPAEIAYFALGLLGLAVLTLVVFRERALANRFGRQMSALLVVVLATFAAASGLVAARGGSAAEAAAHAMASLAGVMGAGAIALDRRLYVSASASAVAALACQLHPPTAPLSLGLAGVVSVAVFFPESIRNARAPVEPP